MFSKDVNTRILHKGYLYSQALWAPHQKQFSASKEEEDGFD